MATTGKNTVINAHEEIHEWLVNWSKGKEGIWLFEHPNLMELEGGRHFPTAPCLPGYETHSFTTSCPYIIAILVDRKSVV